MSHHHLNIQTTLFPQASQYQHTSSLSFLTFSLLPHEALAAASNTKMITAALSGTMVSTSFIRRQLVTSLRAVPNTGQAFSG